MPKLVCVSCRTELKVVKNGVGVVDMFNSPPEPYQVWLADLWQCPGCKHYVIAGFGAHPASEHFESNFNDWLAEAKRRGRYDNFERP